MDELCTELVIKVDEEVKGFFSIVIRTIGVTTSEQTFESYFESGEGIVEIGKEESSFGLIEEIDVGNLAVTSTEHSFSIDTNTVEDGEVIIISGEVFD